MDEVLELALVRKPEPIVWTEEAAAPVAATEEGQDGTRLTAH
jgi:hypothetical protein